MIDFLARHRGAIAGWSLSLLTLGLVLAGRDGATVLGRSFGLVASPVQDGAQTVTGGFGSLVDRYVFLIGAQRQASQLQHEVADLRRELLAAEEVYLENHRLKTLLHFKESTELPLLPARVVGRSASSWFRTLTLDKGADDGILPNSPVVTADGVIGRVYQTSPSASRVLLLTDTSSAVDALVQRSRAQVVVEGRLDPLCRILYLARTDDAVPGDRVVTSGLGDVYPKGLLIGEIVSVEPVKGGVFQRAELKPSADFSRVEEVFVVPARSGAAP